MSQTVWSLVARRDLMNKIRVLYKANSELAWILYAGVYVSSANQRGYLHGPGCDIKRDSQGVY